MSGLIVGPDDVERARARLADLPAYDAQDFTAGVGADHAYAWDGRPGPADGGGPGPHIVVVDEGLKYNILRMLRARGCRITVVPPRTAAGDLLGLRPDGVLLSPGPGDPALREAQVALAGHLGSARVGEQGEHPPVGLERRVAHELGAPGGGLQRRLQPQQRRDRG